MLWHSLGIIARRNVTYLFLAAGFWWGGDEGLARTRGGYLHRTRQNRGKNEVSPGAWHYRSRLLHHSPPHQRGPTPCAVHIFEVGGKGKKFRQIKDLPDSYVVNDDVEIGIGNKIPLWLFGFLY